jgi:dihydropyrimidine dehydrogenase (NAD+) subunit PreT
VHALDIPVFTGFKPAGILGEQGKVRRFLGSGMFDDSTLELPADMVVIAIGQEPDQPGDLGSFTLNGKYIGTDNCMTNIDGVFAAGDVAEGDKTVVYAVNSGKEAAHAVKQYLLAKPRSCMRKGGSE